MPPAGIDPAAVSAGPSDPRAATRAARPRQCNADYRWTEPKVVAFLEALAKCGRVAEAARMVGMSRQAAYDLRARLASARFSAAFEGARCKGIRARAAASRARVAAAHSPWEGPGIAELAARYRGAEETAPGSATAGAPQADTRTTQADTFPSQADTGAPQVYIETPQTDGISPKPTKSSPGPCNTRSMSYAHLAAGAAPASLRFGDGNRAHRRSLMGHGS